MDKTLFRISLDGRDQLTIKGSLEFSKSHPTIAKASDLVIGAYRHGVSLS